MFARMNQKFTIANKGFRSLSLALIFLCGCSADSKSQPDSQTESPFLGMEIEVAAPQGPEFTTLWKLTLDEWAAGIGADYRIKEYDLSWSTISLMDAIAGELSGGSNSAANVLVFPITEVTTLAVDGILGPIPEKELSDHKDSLGWLDLFQGLREQVASIQEKPMIIPLCSPVLVCYYRRDLLENAGLDPPQTWQDYQRFVDTLERWAVVDKEVLTAVEPWGEDFRSTMFLARAVSYAKHPSNYSLFFDIQSGEPLVDGPGFVRALESAQAAVQKMPEEIRRYTPSDCRRDFFAGKAAMAITFETALDNLPLSFGPGQPVVRKDRPSTSATNSGRIKSMNVGFCRLPGVNEVYNRSSKMWEQTPDESVNRVALTAFGGLCIGVSANRCRLETQAAWDLVKTLAVDKIANTFPHATKSLCRESQLAEASSWIGADLTADERGRYLSTVSRSLNNSRVVAELPVVERARFRVALTEALGTLLAGATTPRAALKDVGRRWRQIVEKIGAGRVRDSYRIRLGLAPLGSRK